MSLLLRLGGFASGLGTGIGMYYFCVVQRMQNLQGQSLAQVSKMEEQLRAATNGAR